MAESLLTVEELLTLEQNPATCVVLNALLAFSESTVALQAACRQRRRGQDLKSGTRLSLQIQTGIKEDFGADWRISSISETRDGFETFNI